MPACFIASQLTDPQYVNYDGYQFALPHLNYIGYEMSWVSFVVPPLTSSTTERLTGIT